MNLVFRNKLFGLYALAEVAASLAVGVDLSIYGFWLYELTGSVFIVSLASMLLTAGPMIFGRLIGGVLDRWNPFTLLTIVNVLFVISSIVPIFINSKAGIPIVLLSVVGVSLAYTVSTSIWAPLSTLVIQTEDLPKATGVLTLIENFRLFVGTAVGGFLYTLVGPHKVFAMESCLFVIAILVSLMGVRLMRKESRQVDPVEEATVEEDQAPISHKERIKRVFADTPLLRSTLRTNMLAQVSFSSMNALWAPFLILLFQADTLQIGFSYIAQAIGGIIGSILITRRLGQNPKLERVRWLYLVFGMTTLLYTVMSDFRLLLLLLIIEGIALEWGRLPLSMVWLNVPPKDMRGAMFAYRQSRNSTVAVVSILLTGYLADVFGVKYVFIGVVSLFFLLTALNSWTLRGNPLEYHTNKNTTDGETVSS